MNSRVLTKLRYHACDQHDLTEVICGDVVDPSMLNGGNKFIPRENNIRDVEYERAAADQ